MSGCCYHYVYCSPEPIRSYSYEYLVPCYSSRNQDPISFSRIDEQIFRGMEEIFKNDPFVEGYKKSCKIMADNAYELNCGGVEIMKEDIKPCKGCIHDRVCAYKREVADDMQKVEAIVGKTNRLKVTCKCGDYIPIISQENHSS